MITALDSAVLDANSEELGVSVSELMENAGRALAEEVDALSPGTGKGAVHLRKREQRRGRVHRGEDVRLAP